ncbi:aminotransferase class I/II-fold pyridoxal phosphate-dependent enzyme [Rathayibacter soli]|uniref:aminotransferase class I/II-fold pyridoxal phosphate-dependent enzyme n=1 Tax=Rathayibacter soli TaxID=3144168 RepID=UPI0027E5B7C0|nr:aminotransferase class I/II-fold pyridoxal phosphate-dependent enzyme [Glaciibacter superstes]
MMSLGGIAGSTAAEIALSVRERVDSGLLAPGVPLPPIRELASALGLNRNTVAAAYAQLGAAGVVESRRRAGTIVRGLPRVRGEGATSPTTTINLAAGNPDASLLPPITSDFLRGYTPLLYGAVPVSPALRNWAATHMSPDVVDSTHDLIVTHGAVDAVERLLDAYLTRGDLVAVEDPCFLSSIGTLRLNGYRSAPITVDRHGIRPDALEAALATGARAVICTPRAHNPTGASVTPQRALELAAVLERYPNVVVIEDDHFSAISAKPYNRITPASTSHWALVRSVSKFLGPDLRVALVLADPETCSRLGSRLSSATTWVSHILQHIVATMLDHPVVLALLDQARAAYTTRSSGLTAALGARNISVNPDTDGLNVWIPVDVPEARVVTELSRLGWCVQPGSAFALTDRAARAIRVTTATMSADDAVRFAHDLAGILRPIANLASQ